MRAARFTPGTKSPSTPSDYTDAQYAALEKLKHTAPKLKYGAAKKDYVNRVLLPDGKISKDLDAVRKAIAKAETADRAELDAFLKENQAAIVKDELTPEQRQRLVNLRENARHRLGDEFEEHIRQKRFLFIVDAELIPRIYFQCFTGVKSGKPLNPDLELA